jgi:hypothetical protein
MGKAAGWLRLRTGGGWQRLQLRLLWCAQYCGCCDCYGCCMRLVLVVLVTPAGATAATRPICSVQHPYLCGLNFPLSLLRTVALTNHKLTRAT